MVNQERLAELLEKFSTEDAMIAHIAELEEAVRNLIPMAAIMADSYARNYEVPGGVLHASHAEALDRASNLIGDGPISHKLKRK